MLLMPWKSYVHFARILTSNFVVLTFDLIIVQEDVFLICSNAMQYNAPDTIYFRQVNSVLNSEYSMFNLSLYAL